MPFAIALESGQGFSTLVLDSRYANESEAQRGMAKLIQGNAHPYKTTRKIVEVNGKGEILRTL